ncbi:uncharacterized oxidoreductase [Pedobacter westerhofensis]|uniref:Uncharacterized oxidoreductase n=1 Tax=Pedobacter westerhofensis TaxID=425512 RepID=A0A521BPE5_9SPHI|nr:SDR family NAD(P)-dependent oxidoreductase [Pedobacter westerhofensis]SMO48979.1 uncharacterized oxidoreductase [Pedobacter westerhofensis]
MDIQNKKTLITGGGSGIGFSIAKAFSEAGAEVILVGRNEERLKISAASLKNATYIAADVGNTDDVQRLVETVTRDGGIDILINNAGVANYLPALLGDDYHEKAKEEMDINFFAVLNLINKFLPVLKQREAAAIINLESILVYAPSINASTYSASKAALRSYSQSLRMQLEKESINIKIFEVFPPLVDTDMTAGLDIVKIAPEVVANDLVAAVLTDEFYIRSGMTENIYQAMLASPENAVLLMNSH